MSSSSEHGRIETAERRVGLASNRSELELSPVSTRWADGSHVSLS